jgi:NAD(P)H-dependent FMN reductase
MTPLEIVLLFGSVRTERQGIRAVRFVERQFRSRGHDVTVVDPLEVQLPLLDRMFKEYPPGAAPETLQRLAALYRRADAFVIITGEYNHSIPPALTNLLDHFLEEYFFRPSAIVCYSSGSFGGVRAAVQLRAMLCELGMPSTPSLFPIPRIRTALADDGTPADPAFEKRFDKFASELEWYADALRQKRNAGLPY